MAAGGAGAVGVRLCGAKNISNQVQYWCQQLVGRIGDEGGVKEPLDDRTSGQAYIGSRVGELGCPICFKLLS